MKREKKEMKVGNRTGAADKLEAKRTFSPDGYIRQGTEI